MRIVIGADHGGYKLKKSLVRFLTAEGYEVADFGTHSSASCDYPLIGYRVAEAVLSGKFERGILICKTGIGMSMVANKVPGIRAALCFTKEAARASREHNDSNILVLGARFLKMKSAQDIVEVWLKTDFLGGRHARRVKQIINIEKRIQGVKSSKKSRT